MRQKLSTGNFVESVAFVPVVANVCDSTAANSNKVWTVPTNEQWRICSAHVVLVTNAVVGNRQMAFEVKDASGNVITNLRAGAVQAASTTDHYNYMQGIYRETAFTASEIQCPIHQDLYVPPGGSIRFLDETAVAPAGDNMTVCFQYQKMNI